MGKTHKDRIKIRHTWQMNPVERKHSKRVKELEEFDEEEALEEWLKWKEAHPEKVKEILNGD